MKIQATLDPKYDYIATEISRMAGLNGKMSSQWILSNPKKFSGSPYIASEAKLIAAGKSLTTYTVTKAQFTTPDKQEFAFDFHKPNYTVVDGRVNGQAFVYNPDSLPANVTSEELLKLTEDNIKRNNEIIKEQEKLNNAQKKQDTRGSIVRYIILTAIAIIIILFAFVHLRKISAFKSLKLKR